MKAIAELVYGDERTPIVFDYLRDLRGVAKKFVDNIWSTLKRLHCIEMNVDEKVVDLIVNDTALRPGALVLGARGLPQALSTYFTEPLIDFIFGNDFKNRTIVAKVPDSGNIRFSLTRICPEDSFVGSVAQGKPAELRILPIGGTGRAKCE